MIPVEQLGISVIRALAMDAPHAARSGHQGTAMALAPLAHVLWSRIMRYDPQRPHWFDRDRFVLSAGHASILQYAMLYLTGYGLTLDDLRDFRQWGSATPGHPEAGHTPGVEVTTGPLGQGLANAVGMAIAEAQLRARFGAGICSHRVFAIVGDGDLAEGVSHEAASLAGHLRLGRLVVCYDDNRITIDGGIELSQSDDTAARFRAYGWHVEDLGAAADDTVRLEAGLRRAVAADDRPSLVVIRSVIGSPAPQASGTSSAHGYAILDAEIAATKDAMGLPPDQSFHVPDEVLAYYREAGARGRSARQAWEGRLAALDGAPSADEVGQGRKGRRRERAGGERAVFGDFSAAGDAAGARPSAAGTGTSAAGTRRAVFDACLAGGGLPGWEGALPEWAPGEMVATRKASHAALQALLAWVPGLISGSADLTGSTGTAIAAAGGSSETDGADDSACVFSASRRGGRQIYFGVREHAMGGIANGMALHGGTLPVVGTFLVFADYMRPAVRLAALSQAKVIFVWTHDSVGVGEDGPTHQPVEHLASLRAIPGLRVIRPADAKETSGAWRTAIASEGPTALVLTRQKVPVLADTSPAGAAAGGYALHDPADAVITLVGTGSEVSVCCDAAAALAAQDDIAARVVSLPCWELFAEQSPQEQDRVLRPDLPSLSVEAGSTMGWRRWADEAVGIDRFGSSAPGATVMEKLGISADAVAERARALLGRALARDDGNDARSARQQTRARS